MKLPGSVRLRDGIEIELSSGETVVADARSPDGDINVLSHAHGDHLYQSLPDEVICSELTAQLAELRRPDKGTVPRTSSPRITQVPAGHIPGSRATLVYGNDVTYLYTGDISTRSRFYLSGFDPSSLDADIDVLIVETTYGEPEYRFPPQDVLERSIIDWLNDTTRPALLFGYTLGRAQELQHLVGKSNRDRLFVTEAIERINAPIEDSLGTSFGARLYGNDVELGADDTLVLPTQTTKLSFVDHLVENRNAVKAGFSGWATDSGFKYRGEYDETFVLSDHCDFTELVDLVTAVDPGKVYTTHGSTDEFASYLTAELGYDARSLKRNQTSLGDF
ncbi:MBL fold metallo-hydrolase RNA specificity domain-containing protein [Haladaptatus caseinilyticus]|uniref:MBL fold metallo-hydrolase RNA specificity domain-containing protein n=1 Tax=Haladaptatus caseinilyticus TaxID=2993314 RepID=UPI00224B167C|nr:MBL fold metallo-hydrolase RNA specificity domain-containing protein [Haladaptatus caseinilyticus]